MSVTPDILERFETLQQEKPGHDHVLEGLEDKTLLALIGGHQSGKSTIARYILKSANNQMMSIGEIGTHTNRRRKYGESGDPPQYMTADEGVTAESLLDDYQGDKLLNISLLETGYFYATRKTSLRWKHNVLPMLPGSVEMARGAVGTLHTAYIMPEAEWWQDQFDGPVAPGRLDEMLTSLDYAQQDHPNLLRIVNQFDRSGMNQRRIAEKLVEVLAKGERWYADSELPFEMTDGFDTEANRLRKIVHKMLDNSRMEP